MVTLALEYDVDAIQDAGLIDDGWVDEFSEDSASYTSTIVFLVRKGNPKNIQRLGRSGKERRRCDHTNPKTSGGARWNYLAAGPMQKINITETRIKLKNSSEIFTKTYLSWTPEPEAQRPLS